MSNNFRRLFNNLNDTTSISIPISLDKDGYIDRECPSEKCMFQFKIFGQDWKDSVNNEQVFCPLCRHEAHSDYWHTTEQVERAKKQAIEYFKYQVGGILKQMADDFNAGQPSNGLFTLKMGYDGPHGSKTIMPLIAKDEMELKIACKNCSVRYAVIGSAFFCPCCGHNSAEEMFDNAVKKIEYKIEIDEIKRALVESIGKDQAEVTCRSLVETGLNDCVVAFQRFCEVAFSKLAPHVKLKQNVFQRLDEGESLWVSQTGQGYSHWISATEMQLLKTFFQRRHLLAHTDGIVDNKYVNSVGDGYQVGQRIVVRPDDVRKCLAVVVTLVNNIKRFL